MGHPLKLRSIIGGRSLLLPFTMIPSFMTRSQHRRTWFTAMCQQRTLNITAGCSLPRTSWRTSAITGAANGHRAVILFFTTLQEPSNEERLNLSLARGGELIFTAPITATSGQRLFSPQAHFSRVNDLLRDFPDTWHGQCISDIHLPPHFDSLGGN